MSSDRTSTTKVRSPIAGILALKSHGVMGLHRPAILPALMVAGMGLFVAACTTAQAQERDTGRAPRAENAPGPLRLTEQQKRRVTSFLTEFLPGVLEEINLLSETNPRHLERELVYLFPRVSVLLRQRESQPEVFALSVKLEELEYAIRRLARDTRSRPSQKEGSKEELERLIGEKFDLELQRSTLQLGALSRRLEELRDQLERRTAQKEQLVQRELETRLGPAGPPRPPRHRPPPGDREPANPDRSRAPTPGLSEPRSR